MGILLIASVAAGVSVRRNSEALNRLSLLSLLYCLERELRVLHFQARSLLRPLPPFTLAQDFLFHVLHMQLQRTERAELLVNPSLDKVTTQINS